MTELTSIFIIRHAESQPDAQVPEPLWPLSERGKKQATDLVPFLKKNKIGVLYSSPYPRAIDTLQPYAADCDLKISLENDLRERKLTENFRTDWQSILIRAWSDFDYALENCESSRIAQLRIVSAVKNIALAHRGETVAIASHGNVIGLLLNSIHTEFGYDDWKTIRNPDAMHIVFDGTHLQWNRQQLSLFE